MSRPRRLSLRARLLVLLVAVTGAFLVIMGIVTAVVLSKRLTGQFRAGLAARSRNLAALAADPAGYVAAAVSPRAGQATAITPGHSGAQLEQALSQLSRPELIRDYYRQPFTVTLPGGAKLTAVARPTTAGKLTGVAAMPPGLVLVVVARPLGAVASPLHGVVFAELITGGALLALLAIGGRWLIGQGLAPLGDMAGTASQITARGDLAARMPEADDSTEVGQLGSAINTMLDRIQQAFTARVASEEKVRQFAADASHELRTPLTTIRGYAELYRAGALGPGQLPDAMRRIEQEAQRMSTLVAELLELARLDRSSSLDLAEADLAMLVRDAAADARAVEPDRPVHAEAPGRLVAVVDEARIRQVLANLLANAREHTPPAAAVWVRLAQVPGGVVLEVADAGPGMSGQEAARAFDRFYRGGGQKGNGGGMDGTAGGPAARGGGSGLGLSIVQAIARAHGGQAVLESWPGQGTRVRVWLPAIARS